MNEKKPKRVAHISHFLVIAVVIFFSYGAWASNQPKFQGAAFGLMAESAVVAVFGGAMIMELLLAMGFLSSRSSD